MGRKQYGNYKYGKEDFSKSSGIWRGIKFVFGAYYFNVFWKNVVQLAKKTFKSCQHLIQG